MTPLYTQALEQRRKEFAGHFLQLDLLQPGYASFLLTTKPGYRGIGTCVITFLPTGIVITGDVAPGHNGIVSSRGYGIEWFAGQNSPSYLAEKFLSQRWVEDHCAELLVEQADDLKDTAEADGLPEPDKAKELRSIADEIKRRELMMHEVYERLQDLDDGLVDDGMPGHWYDPWEMATLAAIQERFAAEYHRLGGEFHEFQSIDWLQRSEYYRINQEISMEKYRHLLGWGINGPHPECWILLDSDVEALAKLRSELPKLATNLVDAKRSIGDACISTCGLDQLDAVLMKLKDLGIEPFATVAS